MIRPTTLAASSSVAFHLRRHPRLLQGHLRRPFLPYPSHRRHPSCSHYVTISRSKSESSDSAPSPAESSQKVIDNARGSVAARRSRRTSAHFSKRHSFGADRHRLGTEKSKEFAELLLIDAVERESVAVTFHGDLEIEELGLRGAASASPASMHEGSIEATSLKRMYVAGLCTKDVLRGKRKPLARAFEEHLADLASESSADRYECLPHAKAPAPVSCRNTFASISGRCPAMFSDMEHLSPYSSLSSSLSCSERGNRRPCRCS